MAAQLHVLQGGAPRVQACGDCRHKVGANLPDDDPYFWKCAAFAGSLVSTVRGASDNPRCPGFEPRPPVVRRPHGWLRRWFTQLWQWIW